MHLGTGWVKGNTDGASKKNLGPSSTTFCIRDILRDRIVAKRCRIKDTKVLWLRH